MVNRNDHEHDPFYRVNSNGRIEDEHDTIDEVTNNSFLEETSAEFTHPIREDEDEQQVSHIYGWIGLALSIISLFFLPVLFAIVGIIIGIIARNRQSSALGYSAIIIGVISLIIHYLMMPFF